MQSVTLSWAPELAMPIWKGGSLKEKLKILYQIEKKKISKVTRCYLSYYLLVYLLFF